MPGTEDDDFENAFEGFGEDKPQDVKVEKEEEKKEEPEKETPEKPEEKKEEPQKEEPEKKEEEQPKPDEDAPKKEDPEKPEDTKKPEEQPEPEKVPEDETPAPLTKDDVKDVINNIRTEERTSARELDNAAKDVLESYYPDGLSNVLVDEKTGKQLKTPQDVIEASGGEMSPEEANQWLMNEQFKLDKNIDKIKNDARQIAETTINFKRDSELALQKYEPLFKEYPQLQKKVYDKLMKQVQVDKEKNVILASPDVMEHYDDYLEPYQQAYEHKNDTPATNPVNPEKEEPAKPSKEDRMDVGGDGGTTPVDDPNDFAQQVKKELAKGI